MNIDNYYVLALNHKATAIENIGDFTIDNDVYDSVVSNLFRSPGVEEVVYLSTCNRVEVWIYTKGAIRKDYIFDSVFKGNCFGKLMNTKNDFFELQGELALLHMVNVACSLDSMVVGEREIFGQLRKAFAKANVLGVCGKNLNLAFRKITEVSKAVYSKTQIANQKVSVASIACHELRKLIPSVEETNITLIGAGETIQLVSKYLANHSFNSIEVLNRSIVNARKVLEIIPQLKIGGLNNLKSRLKNTNVIITCTGSTEPVITEKEINNNSNYTILDLAVPSDTSAAVQKMDNVHFIGVNDLKEIANRNIKDRLGDLNNAATIALEGWEELIFFLKEREVVYKTKAVHQEIDSIFNDDFITENLECFKGEEMEKVTKMFSYINKKLNKIPAKISKEILIQKNA